MKGVESVFFNGAVTLYEMGKRTEPERRGALDRRK